MICCQLDLPLDLIRNNYYVPECHKRTAKSMSMLHIPSSRTTDGFGDHHHLRSEVQMVSTWPQGQVTIHKCHCDLTTFFFQKFSCSPSSVTRATMLDEMFFSTLIATE